MNTYTQEDLKSMAEDVKLAQFLRDIYKWEDDYSISYASRKTLWENKLAGKDQDLKGLDKYREQMVHTVQTILRLWSNGYSEVELEAECAEDVVEQVLRFACNNIDCRELGKVHASCGAGQGTTVTWSPPHTQEGFLEALMLCRGEGQFLGRMVAWERFIKTNGNDSFMVATLWKPGKHDDPRHYYLVKE